jgi:hypothetical protein
MLMARLCALETADKIKVAHYLLVCMISDTSEWIGDEFDPEAFDINAINRLLRTLP